MASLTWTLAAELNLHSRRFRMDRCETSAPSFSVCPPGWTKEDLSISGQTALELVGHDLRRCLPPLFEPFTEEPLGGRLRL